MLEDYLHYGLLVTLAIALLMAAFTDLRRRQIDNWLNAGIALAAPLYWWASGLSLWPGVGIQFDLVEIRSDAFRGDLAGTGMCRHRQHSHARGMGVKTDIHRGL